MRVDAKRALIAAWDAIRWPTAAEADRRHKEFIYQGMLQAALGSLGVRTPPLYPIRGAASHSLLYLLLRVTTETPCGRLLELGAGQSSLFLDAVRQVRPFEAATLETDESWAARIGAQVAHPVVHSPLREKEVRGRLTDGYADLSGLSGRYDVVVVDAPPGAKRYSRWAALEVLDGFLADEFLVIFDDAERRGEQDTIRAFLRGRDVQTRRLAGATAHQVVFTPAFEMAAYF